MHKKKLVSDSITQFFCKLKPYCALQYNSVNFYLQNKCLLATLSILFVEIFVFFWSTFWTSEI